MKKKVAAFVCAAAMVFGTAGYLPQNVVVKQGAITASAETLTYQDFIYQIEDNGEITIIRYNGTDTEVIIPNTIDDKRVTRLGSVFTFNEKVTKVVVPDGVKNIGYRAFESCTNLTSVIIPTSVTEIDYCSFYYCTNLTNITIPDNVTSIGVSAFGSCTSLTSITLPDNLTSIGDSAFSGCTSLTSIRIPDNVTSIGKWAFSGCTSLTRIYVDENNDKFSSVDGVLFDKVKSIIVCFPAGKASIYNIPYGIASIGGSAFSGCKSLTSITIPDSVTSIGDWAFSGCDSLTGITIPESVTSIGDYAFYWCESMTNITIPNSVTKVGKYCFSRCEALEHITMSDNISSFEEGLFENCSKLKEITFPSHLTKMGKDPFEGCTSLEEINFNENTADIESTYLKSSDIQAFKYLYLPDFTNTPWYEKQPDGVIYAGNTVYKYKGVMPENTELTLKTGTKLIRAGAFKGCSGLTNINLPDTLYLIGYSAFEGCSGLHNISIPNSVRAIDSRAFYDCPNIHEAKIPKSVINYGNISFGYYSTNSGTTKDSSFIFKCFDDSPLIEYAQKNGFAYEILDDDGSDYPIYDEKTVHYNGEYFYRYTKNGIDTFGVQSGYHTVNDAAYFINNKPEITNIVIDEGVSDIGEYNSKFTGLKYVKQIIVPDSVTKIPQNAFSNNEQLRRVKLPNNGLSIGNNVFSNCPKLTYIAIPSTFKPKYDYGEEYTVARKISRIYSLLGGATSLKRITINGEMEGIISVDGVLYTADKSEILYCPRGREHFDIPTGTKKIGRYAFSDQEYKIKLSSSSKPLYTNEEPDLVLASQLKSVTIPDCVTAIHAGAFKGCVNLESLIIPESVESIYVNDRDTTSLYETFENCNSLKNIKLPLNLINYSVEYSGGSHISIAQTTTIRIPDNERVEAFPDTLISRCYYLENLDLYDNEKYISKDGLIFDKEETSIKYIPYGRKELTVPKDVKYIEKSNSYSSNQRALENIYVEDGNTVFKAVDGVLYNYSVDTMLLFPNKKTELNIPDTLLFDDESHGLSLVSDKVENVYAQNNPYVATIDGIMYNKNVTEIKYVPRTRTSVSIPNSVNKIGNKAFSNCKRLTSIDIPNSVMELGKGAFSGCPFESVVIPDSITDLNSAFSICTKLKSIKLSKNIQKIGDYDFSQCSSLETFVVPRTVTSIGKCAFWDCYSLSEITIPDSVTEIDADAFTYTKQKTYYDRETNKYVYEKLLNIRCFDGSYAMQYAIDNGFKYTIITEHEHDLTAVPAKVATCEESGNTTYWYCPTCDMYFSDADGLKELTKESTEIKATGHAWGEPTYTWSADNKTCTAKRVCENDNSHVESETVDATSTVKTPATCTEKGTSTYTATFKNAAFSTQTKDVQDIGATGHTAGTAVKENEKPATCMKAGSYDEVVYCTKCHAEMSRTTKTIEALGHSWGEWTVTTPATEDAEGVETRTCEICDETETRAIPKLEKQTDLYTYTETATEWSKDSSEAKTLTIHRSSDDGKTFENFKSVEVDGEVVSPENYTAKSGSLILTFKPEYLATLSEGEHSVKVIFTDGEAEASLTISAPSAPEYILGDANGDGAITVTDISKVAAHVKGIKSLSEEEQKRADANGDGSITVTDISKIAAHVKGIKSLN